MEDTKSSKVLRLLLLLIGNQRTTKELAELLEISHRTLHRYLTDLRNNGFVIEYQQHTIPYLSTREGKLKDLSKLVHFSKEEAFILQQAIESIDGNTQLKQNLKGKLFNLYHYYPNYNKILVNPGLSSNIEKLTEAIETQQTVILKSYHSANSNKVRDRKVEPFQFTTNLEQVWCFDTEEKKCKLFRVSRIKSVEMLDEPWQYKKHHWEAKIDILRNSALEYIGNVQLKLNLRAYNLLREEYPLSEEFLKKITDNSYLLNAPVCDYNGPCRFYLGLFENIDIVGDDNFIEFVNKKISSLKIK